MKKASRELERMMGDISTLDLACDSHSSRLRDLAAFYYRTEDFARAESFAARILETH